MMYKRLPDFDITAIVRDVTHLSHDLGIIAGYIAIGSIKNMCCLNHKFTVLVNIGKHFIINKILPYGVVIIIRWHKLRFRHDKTMSYRVYNQRGSV